MKSSREHNWNRPQRQAAAGVLVIIYKALVTVVKVIWPLLLVFVFRENNKTFDTFEMLLIGIPAFILIRSLIEFYFFRFYIVNDDLIIKRGFLSKRVITIPLNKIQSVHIEQNLVHQVLDVAKLAIDTAGSEKSEAEIDAISISKAESFKEFLLRNEKNFPENALNADRDLEVPLIRLSGGDLLKLGLSANHLQAFFIVLAFGISALQDLSEIFGDRVIRMVEESSTAIGFSLASVVTLIVFVLIVSVVVSVIRIVLTYSNFNCNETEQGLRIRTGLINSRQNLVPFSKIQFISWEANWIRRRIGLFMLELHQAQNEQAKKKQRIRLPITRRLYVDKLLAYYHPAVKPIAHSEHTIHRIYPFRRMLVAGLPMAFVATAVTYFYLNEYAFLFFLLVPYVFCINTIYQRKFRLYISPEAFQINSGAWGKESKIAQWYKIQYLQLNQSIYQRRKQLATLIIHTAGGRITIPYIDLELARTMTNYALFKVEASNKSWI
jgi:putative membrane protein